MKYTNDTLSYGNNFMNPESIRRAENELETELPALIGILNEHIDSEGSLIADELEQTPAILIYATKLDHVLTPDPTEESWQVTYRSIHFAAIVNDLLGCGRTFDFTAMGEVEYDRL